ncbi:MAG TPA: response regulator [Verrucomicrobiae bacterium]|jgi:DNA-binding response OmpR family regulator|nr:response regulator [Verrucomicrobiae bacterium]
MNKKILILDADLNLRTVMAASLGVKGYQVLSCDNGLDGFKMLKKETPDLLILDAGLPKMSGYEVVQKLRTLPDALRKIPVIVMSEKPSMRDLFGPADIHAFLIKPILPGVLLKAVKDSFDHGVGFFQSREKNVIVIDMDPKVEEIVKSFFQFKGIKAHFFSSEMKIFSKIHDLKPKLILAQYAEEPEGFNLPTFCNKILKDPATANYTCRVLCPMSLVKQADKEFVREALITFTEIQDIPNKLEPFLK